MVSGQAAVIAATGFRPLRLCVMQDMTEYSRVEAGHRDATCLLSGGGQRFETDC